MQMNLVKYLVALNNASQSKQVVGIIHFHIEFEMAMVMYWANFNEYLLPIQVIIIYVVCSD